MSNEAAAPAAPAMIEQELTHSQLAFQNGVLVQALDVKRALDAGMESEQLKTLIDGYVQETAQAVGHSNLAYLAGLGVELPECESVCGVVLRDEKVFLTITPAPEAADAAPAAAPVAPGAGRIIVL